VDYAGTARAQAAVGRTIGQQLDRMASVAFREAEVQAKIEGAEFGAANAPSIDQLRQATTPEGREELVPGGTGTVYDRAAREAALRSIANDLDTSAREEIANLRIGAASQNMSVSDLQTQIDGVINGYAGAVYDVSPALAGNFRAGIAASGNSALVAHASNMAEQAEEKRERDAIRGVDVLIGEIPDIVARGDFEGVTVQEYLKLHKEKLFSKAEDLDPSVLSSRLKDFSDATSKAYIAEVTEWLDKDPMSRLIELQRDKIEDPRISSLYKDMSTNQRNSVIDSAFQKASRDLAFDEALNRRNERNRNFLSIELRGEIARGISANQDVSELMERLEDIDGEAFLVLQDRILNSPAANDADAMIALNKIEVAGQMTHQVLLDNLDDGNITFAEYIKRFDRLEVLNRDDTALAVRYLKNAINPVPNIFGSGDDERNKQIGEIENELILAMRKDPDLDPMVWMQGRLKGLKPAGPTAQQITRSQSLVDAFAKQNGIDSDLASVQSKLDTLISDDRATGMNRYAALMDAIDVLRRAE
tara:strand:- start:5451 stop:7049 length:1599 start_codon:yes stop_codon:yes gene_type:complete